MKKRLKLYGLVIVGLVAATILIQYGFAELSAIAWHVRHGFHAEVGGIRLRVPLLYEADDPHGLPSLFISRSPGLLGPGGFITVDFQKLPTKEQRDAAEGLLKEKGFQSGITEVRAGKRIVSLAGRQGTCTEYNVTMNKLRINSYEINCQFSGDVSTMLMGSARLKNDFYSIIESAQPLEAKNK